MKRKMTRFARGAWCSPRSLAGPSARACSAIKAEKAAEPKPPASRASMWRRVIEWAIVILPLFFQLLAVGRANEQFHRRVLGPVAQRPLFRPAHVRDRRWS